MMWWKKRSDEKEWLDIEPSPYSIQEYRHCLKQLDRVGEILGGDRATLKALTHFKYPKSLLDFGCGGGLFTLKLAKIFPQAQVRGVDIAKPAIEWADEQLKLVQLKNCSFELGTSNSIYIPNGFEVITTTLVCHHLSQKQLVQFLQEAYAKAARGVIINDLQRSVLAWVGFKALAPILFRNRLVTHDGAISIKRSFTKQDWLSLLQQAKIPLEQCSVQWHWAFRLVVIIDKQRANHA